ncbi:MAG TPA: hypothetical protein VNV18_01200 [Stellaceae bacterium]|nr:hypothetical protein [Stellaceae bacterium]
MTPPPQPCPALPPSFTPKGAAGLRVGLVEEETIYRAAVVFEREVDRAGPTA